MKSDGSLLSRRGVVYIFLHGTELHEPATTAFQVVKHGSQGLELRSTADLVWAVVDLLLMHWAVEVQFQAAHRTE